MLLVIRFSGEILCGLVIAFLQVFRYALNTEKFSVPARQEPAENFTLEGPEKNPSGSSSPSRNESPGSVSPKPSVKQELREIRREQVEKAKSQPIPPKSHSKTKQKGR